MDARLFVLINTKPGLEKDVEKALTSSKKDAKGTFVSEVHPLFGAYDFIVKVEGNNYNDLSEYVNDNIRAMPSVLDTLSITAVRNSWYAKPKTLS